MPAVSVLSGVASSTLSVRADNFLPSHGWNRISPLSPRLAKPRSSAAVLAVAARARHPVISMEAAMRAAADVKREGVVRFMGSQRVPQMKAGAW